MSYFDDINSDYKRLKKILSDNFNELQCFKDKKFREDILMNYHSELFELRDLISECESLPVEALKGLDNGVSDFLDFIWLIYIGRYKAAIASLRNGLDIFGRGLIRIKDATLETNSFSNNIEKVLKEVRVVNEVSINGSAEKKRHKRYINSHFTEKIVNVYGRLSDSIHGRDEKFSNLSQYIESSLDFSKNQNMVSFNGIIEIAYEMIQLVLSIFILVNYNYLNDRMNVYKLNLIIDSQGQEIKNYKFEYFSKL